MKKACIFLAEGFEETEAIGVVDILRRGGVDIKMVAIGNELVVHGSHNIAITADMLFDKDACMEMDALVLPGGMPGTTNLGKHEGLAELIHIFAEKENKIAAAICAAPSVFGDLGILEGKKATCYPGFEQRLTGAEICQDLAVVDGKFLTGRGPGAVFVFALRLLTLLAGEEKAKVVADNAIMNFPE